MCQLRSEVALASCSASRVAIDWTSSDMSAAERELAIKVRGARKSYGRLEVLKDLDMNVPYASM